MNSDAIRACEATFDAESDSISCLFFDRRLQSIEWLVSGARIGSLLGVAVEFIFVRVFF